MSQSQKMKNSLRISFAIIRGRNKLLSFFSCLERTVYGKGVSEKEIRHLFASLVPDTEYEKANRERIILYLIEKTKPRF